MSDYSTNSTINLSVNGNGVEEKIKSLSKQLTDLRGKAQKAAEIGDRGTLQKTNKEIRKVENELRKVQTATANVEDTLKNLDKASPKRLRQDLRTLRSQLNNIERGSDAWKSHVEKIKLLEAELKKINDELKESESTWDTMNRKLEDWKTTILGGTASLTGMMVAAKEAVNTFAEMDTEMANVRKYTGMTSEEVDSLNEEFKKMDTRTSREGLNQLAQEAGRLGKTSKEDVLGFVKAADQINVALDDLGEDATLTLSKLTSIFGDEKIYGTEQSLLKVGSVINELSQNCTASAPFLAEFAQRLAGVGAQAGMTIPQIMSFAAVLDSQGQSVEVSATAMSQFIMHLFQQPEKIAKATGLSLDELNAKLKEGTNEGLMLLLERLNELGNMDVLAPIFKEMGENGSGASAVLAALAGNIDQVKFEQTEANKAFKEGISVTNEFNVQNSTVQAGLDKAEKNFKEMAVELGEELAPAMLYVVSSTTILVKLFSSVISFVKSNALALGTLTAMFIAYKIAVNASNIAFKAHYAWLVVSKAATTAYTATVNTLKAAQLLLSYAMAKVSGNMARQSSLMLDIKKLGPTLASGYGVIAAAVIALGVALYKTIEKMKEAQAGEKALLDIKKKATEQAQDQLSKVQSLLNVARDETASLKDRKTAIEELNNIIPGYNGLLDETTGKYTESTQAVKDYTDALIHQYEVEGAKAKLKELGEQKAGYLIDLAQAQKAQEERRKENVSTGTQPVTTSGAFVPGQVNASMGKSAELGGGRARINDINGKIANIEMQENAIKGVYGKEIDKSVVNQTRQQQTSSTSTGGGSSSGSASSKAKEERFKAEKEWKATMEAYNRIAKALGEEEYANTQDALDIEIEYQNKILARADLTKEERLNAEASLAEALQRQQDSNNKRSLEETNKYFDDLKAVENQRYADGKTDADTYSNALEYIELRRKRAIVSIYKDGTNERKEAEEAYEEADMQYRINQHKKLEELEKEHQKKMDEIRSNVFGNTPSLNANAYQTQLSALTEVYNQELAIAGSNADERLAIEEAFQKAKLALAIKYGQVTTENGFNEMQEMNARILEWLSSDEGNAILGAYDQLTSSMSAIFSQVSSLVQAEAEIEQAEVEKRYDTEITAAEGNKAKVTQLEEQKEKETAKIKNEANSKMYTMEIMQAIASTAMGAINAYSSAAQVPLIGYILAPIAAASAIAAGMIQVASIQKQKAAAEASGYAEGGYTKPGGKYEPAGIVHAGEWVASQRLLADPNASAMIQALDYAQRTNTLGSLSPSMVAEDISAPIVSARTSSRSSLSVSSNLSDTIKSLNDRLNEPFVTINTVTGDNGIKKAQDDYNKYIRNKTPKSRRS